MKINIPSSQGGLNLKDSLDAMESQYAIQMDNIIPDTNRDVLRNGCTKINSSAASCLIAHREQGNSTLLCASGGKIYVVNGANRTELASGFASDDWQFSYFTDSGGTVSTILTNGSAADNVRRIYYSGSTLTMTTAYNSAVTSMLHG